MLSEFVDLFGGAPQLEFTEKHAPGFLRSRSNGVY